MAKNIAESTSPPFATPPVPGTFVSGTAEGVSDTASTTTVEGTPSVEFLPYVDEVEERKKFWQAVFITLGLFSVVTVLVVGFVVSQRLSAPANPKISVQYLDGATAGDGTLPSRQPTQKPTPLVLLSPRPTSFSSSKLPTSRPTPPRSVTNIAVNQRTGTPTPTSALSVTPSVATTLTPTSATLLPTVTPTTTPTNTPTSTPTPTPYLVTSVDTYAYGSVTAGLTATATFQLFNTGGSSLSITNLFIASTGTNNPFTITAGGGCITEASVPITISAGSTKCVNVMFSPTYTSVNSNSLQIYWNNTNIKIILLSGTVPTATPTITPTPTT